MHEGINSAGIAQDNLSLVINSNLGVSIFTWSYINLFD